MKTFNTWGQATAWVDKCGCGGRWKIGGLAPFSECECGNRRIFECRFPRCNCLNGEIRGKEKGVDVFGGVA